MGGVLNITLPVGWIYGAIGLVAVGSFCLGVCLIRSPRWAIEKQMEFYRIINWRMEPVSWEREIRNTRVMGWTAVLAGLAALALIAPQGAIFCIK